MAEQSTFWHEKYLLLQQQYDQLNNVNQTLNQHVMKYRDDNARLHKTVEEFNAQLTEIRNEMESHKRGSAADLANAAEQIKALQKQLSDEQKQTVTLRDRMALVSLTQRSATHTQKPNQALATELAQALQDREHYGNLIVEAVRELTGHRMNAIDAFYELLPAIRRLFKRNG